MRNLLVFLLTLVCGPLRAADTNPFFAMKTIARGGPAEVVPLLMELGYAGLGGAMGDGAMATALEREGLKFFNGYHTISFNADRPALDDRLRGQIDAMKDHGTALWLAVARVQDPGRTFPNSFARPPHSPTPVPVLTVSGAAARKQIPSSQLFGQHDAAKASICWMTVPSCDDQPLTNHTQGISSRFGEYLQHRGSLLLVANDLTNSEFKPKVRTDLKGHKPFTTDAWYVLAYIPHGYHAVINDSKETGRVFLDYGSVLIAFSASQPFDWNPAAKVFAGNGKGGFHPNDSEFRVFGQNAAVAMETALPEEFPGATPAERLAKFKSAIVAKTKVTVANVKSEPAAPTKDKPTVPVQVAKGVYLDRFGTKLEKTFQGEALIDGKPVDYASWPLVDNPWIHQDWEGNMRISDGVTERIYDVTNWTITERKVSPAKTGQ